jgi:hypothetical protein
MDDAERYTVTAAARINSAPASPFSIVIQDPSGTVLVRLFQNEAGLLDAEIPDRSRLTEAALLFASELAGNSCRLVIQ